jgi:monoamine oxidase
MSDRNEETFDVVIIGAGFTGIAAARELAKTGLRFCVLDSFADHLGGRAYTYAYKPGGALGFDHGAEYVGDLQNGIMQQIRELGLEETLVNGAHLRLPYPWEVMILDQTRYLFKASECKFGIAGVPPQLTTAEVLGMLALLAEMWRIEVGINVVEPWKSPSDALALDRLTIKDWLGQAPWKWIVSPTVYDLMRISVEALLSVEPEQISPFYFLWYTACNDGFLNEINDNQGGPQQYWLYAGTSELAARYAKPVADRIRQPVKVLALEDREDGVTVKTDAGTLSARKVLIATSPRTAGRIAYAPELPPARREFLSLPMGKTIKCQVFYKSAWWHDSNGLAYDGYVGGADYPVLWVMDNTPPSAGADGPFVLMTFTVGHQVDMLGPDASDEQIATLVTATLGTIFQDYRALQGSSEFVKIVIHRWVPRSPEVGGGPNTVFTPGTLSGDVGKLLTDPWNGNLYFASSETAMNLTPMSPATTWKLFTPTNEPQYDAEAVLLPTSKPPFKTRYSDRRRSLGYMDGAMESGRYAAHAIAGRLGLEHQSPIEAPPEEPAREPAPPPSTSSLPPSAVSALLGSMKAELDGAAGVSAGVHGTAAHLYGVLTRALVEQGHLAGADDPVAVAVAARDFFVSAASHLSADPAAHEEAERPHLATIGATLGGIEARVRSFFG